jgi:hypothetical protein
LSPQSARTGAQKATADKLKFNLLVHANNEVGKAHAAHSAFALHNRQKFAGALTAGWHAFNITSDKGTPHRAIGHAQCQLAVHQHQMAMVNRQVFDAHHPTMLSSMLTCPEPVTGVAFRN